MQVCKQIMMELLCVLHRAEELVVVPYSDEYIFVTICNEPFSICALGYVTSTPRRVLPSCPAQAHVMANGVGQAEKQPCRLDWRA